MARPSSCPYDQLHLPYLKENGNPENTARMCIGQNAIRVYQLINFDRKYMPIANVWTSVDFLFLDGF